MNTKFLDSLLDPHDLWFIEQNNQLYAGAVVLKDSKGKVIQAQYPFSMYQGIVFSSNLEILPLHTRITIQSNILKALLKKLSKTYDKISFCLHHSFEDLREIQWFNYHKPNQGNFKIDLRYTGIVNLSKFHNFEDYLKSLNKTRRYEYKKAKKLLNVNVSNNIQTLDNLHQLTFERQGIERGKKASSLLQSITNSAIKNNFGELVICKDAKRQPASASLFLYDQHTGYYLFGANNPKFRKTNSGTYLVLENIRRAKKRKISYIDVCGINSPNRGDFKVSLGAKPVPYFIATWKKP